MWIIQKRSLFFTLLLVLPIIQSEGLPFDDFNFPDTFASSYKEYVNNFMSKRLNGELSETLYYPIINKIISMFL